MRNCTAVRIQRGDLGRGLAAPAIEEDDAIAWLEAQHAARMVRFGTGERGERPFVRRKIETVHETERLRRIQKKIR